VPACDPLPPPNACKCFRARNRRPTDAGGAASRRVFSLSLFCRIQIYEGTTSGQPSRATRVSCFPRPLRYSPQSIFLPAVAPRTRDSPPPFSFRNKKKENQERKNLAASLPRATWLVARFFSLPYYRALPVFPPVPEILDSEPLPPLSTTIGPTSGKTEVSEIRVTNSPALFFSRARVLPFSAPLRLPFPFRSAGGRAAHNARKKNFIENLFNGTTETGPGADP